MTNTPIAAKLAEALRHARKELEGACTALDILCVHTFNVIDEALAEYDTAKGAEPPSLAWQPIDTAPKDGSSCLVFDESIHEAWWYDDESGGHWCQFWIHPKDWQRARKDARQGLCATSVLDSSEGLAASAGVLNPLDEAARKEAMTDSQNRREALLSRAATTQAGEQHPAYDEKLGTFNVPADLMRRVWNTLDIYANPTCYRGERIGGILQGCPRAPDPTPEEMSRHAYATLQEMIRWRWPKEAPSQPVAPVVADGPYKIEPHGDVWVLYSGRSSMFHGWNLARISEPSVGILELIEKALNAFAAPAQPQPSSEETMDNTMRPLGKPSDYTFEVAQEPTAADTERVDFMAREFEKNGCMYFDQYAGCQLFTVSSQHVRGKNLRETIDKAREIARERKA